MIRNLNIPYAAVGVAGCMLLFATNSADAAGRWNMPSTTIQMVGSGFGPGYHAPMVLGRCWKGAAASPGVERVGHPLYAPSASCEPTTAPCSWPTDWPTDEPATAAPIEAPAEDRVLPAPTATLAPAPVGPLFTPPQFMVPAEEPEKAFITPSTSKATEDHRASSSLWW